MDADFLNLALKLAQNGGGDLLLLLIVAYLYRENEALKSKLDSARKREIEDLKSRLASRPHQGGQA